MKTRFSLLILSIFVSLNIGAQSAMNQLKSIANTNVSIPPASKCVCAYCKGQNGHKSSCIYAPKTSSSYSSTTSSSASTSSNSTKSTISSLTSSLMTSMLSSYLTSLPGKFERIAQMNAAAQKMYGVSGGEADGYVVAIGTDGYYSVWSDKSRKWVFNDPASSTLTDIIMYNAHATCIQRWLGHKWGVFDVTVGNTSKNYRNAIEVFKYDSVKCVAKDAPIAVGKKKGKNYIWGLITKENNSDSWSHTVENKWDNFDILPTVLANFAVGRKDGKLALFAQDGTILVPLLYESFLPAFSDETRTFFFVSINSLWGLIDQQGTVYVPCEYDDIKYVEEGVLVKKNEEWFLVN